MGEAVDLMLEGETCETCHEEMCDFDDPEWEPAGHPDYCSTECAKDRLPHTVWWFEARGLPVPTTE